MARLDNASSGIRLMCFRIGGSACAVPLLQVREVADFPALVASGGAEPGLAGWALLRGVRVPIYSLVGWLSPARVGGPVGPALVLYFEFAGQTLGLAIDELEQVLTVEERDLCRLPPGAQGYGVAELRVEHQGEPRLLLQPRNLPKAMLPVPRKAAA